MDFKHPVSFLLIVCTLFCAQTCKNSVEPSPTPQTIDTTIHNFAVLKVDTLGSIFSIVNGVNIVDENNIWVAGIFTWLDGTGETHYDHNLAHWDGQKWE